MVTGPVDDNTGLEREGGRVEMEMREGGKTIKSRNEGEEDWREGAREPHRGREREAEREAVETANDSGLETGPLRIIPTRSGLMFTCQWMYLCDNKILRQCVEDVGAMYVTTPALRFKTLPWRP